MERFKLSKFLKIKPVKGEEKKKRIVEKERLKNTMKELRRMERAERIQEKIVEKRRLITERARLKGDSELIKRVEEEEEEAKAILERIRADKIRVEEELKQVLSAREQKVELEPGIPEEELGGEVAGGEENEIAEIEKYPVNEPYAYILIDNTAPPTYRVSEVRLTRGEAELLKEI
ncbi:hypothetical protein CW713_04755, partial [Methanophagales archaeon]